MTIPRGFNPTFLDWFRRQTETAWARPRMLDLITKQMVPWRGWQRHTQWLGGATAAEVAAIERKWSVRFPPDHRLFLQRLFKVDRPQLNLVFKGRQGVLREEPAFYHGIQDAAAIRRAFRWLRDGLVFDVEKNRLWLPSWGPKPSTQRARKARVYHLVDRAPKLFPLYAHRFLLLEPCRSDNPVFSIWQSDIIVYGPTLRTYLLNEFQPLTGYDPDREWRAAYRRQKRFITTIPFWGELLLNQGRARG